MQQRVLGFDLARAYAILGMFIVNFNFCFGSFGDRTVLGQFVTLFTGNSTSIFIICAGMGVTLMTTLHKSYSVERRREIKSVILKRSWFLFALGLLLYLWWPGDILHFYGGYMHLAALLLFVPRQYFLWGAVAAIIIFHLLLFIIPIGTSWDFATFAYADFWTLKGFLRNTFYNGWNAIFPWSAYFLLGMWLGRLDWKDNGTIKRIFIIGLLFFFIFEGLRKYALYKPFKPEVMNYIMAEYFPPYIPFMVITASFALMVIASCIWMGNRFSKSRLLNWLSETGKMTLTHYVLHLTIGMLLFQALTGKKYTGLLQMGAPSSPAYILVFSATLFLLCVLFSVLWSKRFRKGPLEMVMRKFSDNKSSNR